MKQEWNSGRWCISEEVHAAMSEAMELTNETLETIGGYVRRNLSIWMKEVVPPVYAQIDPQLMERMVRAEETLTTQRDLLKQILEQNDRHFTEQREDLAERLKEHREDLAGRFREQREDLAERLKEQREDIAERFREQREDIAERFREQREDFAARFEQIDKRFDERREDIAERFKEQREDFAARFEQMDRRFDEQREDFAARFKEQREDFAARFEQMDKRFDDLQRHSNRWMTVISIMLGLIGVAMTVTALL